MKKFLFSAVVAALVIGAPTSQAEAKGGGQNWILDFDLSYVSSKTEDTVSGASSTNELATTYYDVSLGYQTTPNWVLGAIYSTKNDSTKSPTVSTSTSGNALGVSAGYLFDNGVHLTGSYFLTATDGEYKKGTGYELDFGWRIFMSTSFFVGAKLAYRSLKYTENSTIAGFESRTSTTTLPYISLGFSF